MAAPKKILRCMLGRCKTCPYLKEGNFFSSNSTNVNYSPILKSCDSLTCQTENVVYLISCKICNILYRNVLPVTDPQSTQGNLTK